MGGFAERAGERDVVAADAALVRELEDALGARVGWTVHRVAEAGQPLACVVDRARHLLGHLCRPDAGSHACLCLFQQPRAFVCRSEDHGSAAQDARGNGALQRVRIGRQRHPRRDVRGHHPVLGDRDQQQVEEEALVLARLCAGEQQVEVLREAEPAHQIAGQITPAHLDAIGMRLADAADAAHFELRSHSDS